MSVFNNPYFKKGPLLFGVIFICIATACSCKNGSKEKYLHAYENKLGIKPSKLAQIDTANFTTIQWIKPDSNFGTIKEGDSVIIHFRCQNTGDNPLFLSEIKSPCGCTVPHYTEKVILPGEEDELPVHFNSIGQDEFVHKTIVVTSNTSNGAKHVLSFEGRVIPAGKPVKSK